MILCELCGPVCVRPGRKDRVWAETVQQVYLEEAECRFWGLKMDCIIIFAKMRIVKIVF